MKFEIKSRLSGEVLFSLETETIRSCVEAALWHGTDMSGADLSGANLSEVDLHKANLYRADLSGANLYEAYLSGADLSGADLSGADLSRAYLSGANLYGADLSGADLSRANLSGANLYGADLSGTNLSGTDLSRANLSGARGLENQPSQTVICPVGEFIGWKKCRDGIILKLLIPADAKRSNASGRKCRAEFVRVLELSKGAVGLSMRDGRTEYRTGETVKCDNWDSDWTQECSGGIHFFITREEAEAFEL